MEVKKIEVRTPYINSFTRSDSQKTVHHPMENVDLLLTFDDVPIKLGSFVFETGLGPKYDKNRICGGQKLWDQLNAIADVCVESFTDKVSLEDIHGLQNFMIDDKVVYYTSETVERSVGGHRDYIIGFYMDNVGETHPIHNASFLGDKIREEITARMNA